MARVHTDLDQRRAFPRRDALLAPGLYIALTLVLTWPLAAGLTHDVPGDFGDPLFASWVLSWDVTHLGTGFWNANIFAPHPLSLAYSEHFLPQALQILPMYAATKNPILCYNLVFLSTFVLSGLGMFLLGRELTASRAAGYVAGLAYAFAPYRIASIPHLQVLSSAWMPFVLFGLHRHFSSGRIRPLAGAAAAWFVQNLSCGYYLLFFSPMVVLYIAWEWTRRGLWADGRALLRVALACAAVFAATAPFLWPYLELRSLGFSPRSSAETRLFSADVYAYLTADPSLRLWGPIARAWPKAEGLLFPGLTSVVLAGLALRRKGAAVAGTIVRIAFSGVVVALLLGWSIRLPGLKITSLTRVLIAAAAAGAARLAASPHARAASRRWCASPVSIFSAITCFAVVMSFGLDIHAKGRVVEPTSLYAAFFHYVPGFDGLRVPARYGMIVTLGLSALAAMGIASLARDRQRAASIVAGTLIVLEAAALPIPINQNSLDYKQTGLAPLPASVATGASAPEVYRFIARLPSSVSVMELPLGEPAFDLRYMIYSTVHWKRLVNGYSGGFPDDYGLLTHGLQDIFEQPDRAWRAIGDSHATHVIVHEGFYSTDRGRRLSDWLSARGARDEATFGTDRVFSLVERR